MKLAQFLNAVVGGFAALLEREAGYHVVSLILIGVGVTLVDQASRAQVAHDLVIFGTGVLARSMGAKKNPPTA
jgi:hypothetical protein